MFINRVTLAGYIWHPDPIQPRKRRIGQGEEARTVEAISFTLAVPKGYLSLKEPVRVECMALRDHAAVSRKYLRGGDWVMVDGSLYERKARPRCPYPSHTTHGIFVHNLDLMPTPLNVTGEGRVRLTVPYSHWHRYVNMEAEKSRWEVPRHMAEAILSQAEVAEFLEAEDEAVDHVVGAGLEPGRGDLPRGDAG